MLHAVLSKSWKLQPTKQQLYGHLPLILPTFQVRWARYVGYCWWSKDKLINNVLLWTPTHGHTSVCWPVKTWIHQLSVNTECCRENSRDIEEQNGGWVYSFDLSSWNPMALCSLGCLVHLTRLSLKQRDMNCENGERGAYLLSDLACASFRVRLGNEEIQDGACDFL